MSRRPEMRTPARPVREPEPRAARGRSAASLNAARRARELDALSHATAPVDVLVIGGGVTGCGIALDAASRGLSVVLAEKADLAFGTSRWSSKLVHGGLRYLASGSVGIAHESAVERGILIRRTAPHLVHPLAQVVPLLPGVGRRQEAVVRAGLLAGDGLRVAARTPGRTLGRSRRVSAATVGHLVPTVRRAGLRGGLLGWDGQLTDDARLVVALARTAARHGARVLTHCRAEQVNGRGAVLRDVRTGWSQDVPARTVITATGVWSGEMADGVTLRPSRGTHLVLSQETFGGLAAGLTVPVPGERDRFVFALPVEDARVIVGLTDVDAGTGVGAAVPDEPRPSDAEVGFLLETVSAALATPLSRSDLVGAFAGLRPLLDTGAGRTSDISRRHAVITAPDGLTSVVGGKLTTYRRMAEDAVDAAVAGAGIAAGPCRTRDLPLVGAADRRALAQVGAPKRLVRRYGTEAPAVLADAGTDPALLAPVADGTRVTPAELRFAVHHEGALDASDLLDRRTRVGLDPTLRARALPAAQAALAGHPTDRPGS